MAITIYTVTWHAPQDPKRSRVTAIATDQLLPDETVRDEIARRSGLAVREAIAIDNVVIHQVKKGFPA